VSEPRATLPTAADHPPTLPTAGDRPRSVVAGRLLGRFLAWSLVSAVVEGRDRVPAAGPVILASNHTGFVDGPLLFGLSPRPVTFLVKAEMFRGPFGSALRALGQLPVHRGAPDRAALNAALGALRAGGAVGVFPEGTRGAGDFGSVHHGIAYLALRSGAPILPVHCAGTAPRAPGHPLPPRRAPVRVVFGTPFQLAVSGPRAARRTVVEATEQIRQQLAAHRAACSA
jgi:1-acyl-sn-glycerol-3-phosphate acyltransferase